MTNNELILAISDLLDEKLKAQLQPIKDTLEKIDDRLTALEDRMTALEDRMTALEDRMTAVEGRLQIVEDRLQTVEERLHIVEDKVESAEDKLQLVEKNILRLSLCQEYDVVPRLKNIESCYTSTYQRYSVYADKMDTAFTDINLLKIVVSDHSEKLQKLA